MTPASSWEAGIGRQILVRITTDDGLVGWGECFAYGAPLAVCSVVDDALAPLVVGQDPTRIELLVDRMHRALMIWGRRGLAMMAVSGVELALWDLARQGPRRARLPAARRPRPAPPARLREPAALREHGRGAPGRDGGARRRASPRSSSTRPTWPPWPPPARWPGDDVDLMLDTNCPWTVEQAIRHRAGGSSATSCAWLEEPVWPPEDYAGLARVRRALRMPIACGENDATVFGFREIIAAGRRRRRAAQHDQGRRASRR